MNAAFTHAHPLGSRFNGPDRDAWYTAFEVRTVQAEVAFHRTVQLAEIGRFEDDVTFDDHLADFSAAFHDLRDGAFAECLDPENYVPSQALAERLLEAGSLGIVYPERAPRRRHLPRLLPAGAGHECAEGYAYRFRWSGAPSLRIAIVEPA